MSGFVLVEISSLLLASMNENLKEPRLVAIFSIVCLTASSLWASRYARKTALLELVRARTRRFSPPAPILSFARVTTTFKVE